MDNVQSIFFLAETQIRQAKGNIDSELTKGFALIPRFLSLNADQKFTQKQVHLQTTCSAGTPTSNR